MRLLNKTLLTGFAEKHADSSRKIGVLIKEIDCAEWKTPNELKAKYPKASVVDSVNVVLNLCGNKYRIWLKVNYKTSIVIAHKIGNHKEYDKWKI